MFIHVCVRSKFLVFSSQFDLFTKLVSAVEKPWFLNGIRACCTTGTTHMTDKLNSITLKMGMISVHQVKYHRTSQTNSGKFVYVSSVVAAAA